MTFRELFARRRNDQAGSRPRWERQAKQRLHLFGLRFGKGSHGEPQEGTRRTTEIIMLPAGALTEQMIGGRSRCIEGSGRPRWVALERQVEVPVDYLDVRMDAGFRRRS